MGKHEVMAIQNNQLEAGLDQIFADFVSMQTEQRLSFETGKLGDLAVWREKRERAFGSLQFYLRRLMMEQPEQNGQLLSAVRRRIQELLDGEKSLESAAAEQRQILWKKMSLMRKGKRALTGYDLGQGNARPARFLSSKT